MHRYLSPWDWSQVYVPEVGSDRIVRYRMCVDCCFEIRTDLNLSEIVESGEPFRDGCTNRAEEDNGIYYDV